MQKRKSFIHLNKFHRDRIHALYLEGHSQKDIAEVIGVNPGTISRELKRYGRCTWRYSAVKAEADAEAEAEAEAEANTTEKFKNKRQDTTTATARPRFNQGIAMFFVLFINVYIVISSFIIIC